MKLIKILFEFIFLMVIFHNYSIAQSCHWAEKISGKFSKKNRNIAVDKAGNF